MADINIADRTEKYEELIPSEDLKKEYHEFLEKHWFNQPGKRTISEQMFFTALYFANWQKQKMLKENTVLETIVTINDDQQNGEEIYNQWLELVDEKIIVPQDKFEAGDHVKVLLIKDNS